MITTSLAKGMGLPIFDPTQWAWHADGVTLLCVGGEVHCTLSRNNDHFQLDALLWINLMWMFLLAILFSFATSPLDLRVHRDHKIGLPSFRKLAATNLKKVSETSCRTCLCSSCSTMPWNWKAWKVHKSNTRSCTQNVNIFWEWSSPVLEQLFFVHMTHFLRDYACKTNALNVRARWTHRCQFLKNTKISQEISFSQYLRWSFFVSHLLWLWLIPSDTSSSVHFCHWKDVKIWGSAALLRAQHKRVRDCLAGSESE